MLREGESVKECEREREETCAARWRGGPDACLERKRMEATTQNEYAVDLCILSTVYTYSIHTLYILQSNLCLTVYRLRSTLNSLQSNLCVQPSRDYGLT